MSGHGNAQRAGAVVIGGDYQGLAIVRSLGRLGAPVYVVDDERSIGRHSRFTSRFVRVSDLVDEQAIVQTLIDLGRRFRLDGWVLFPTRDEMVAAIARNRDALQEWFRVPTPTWEATRWGSDKRNTHRLATELGIPNPLTFWPADEGELERLDLRFPVIVKPAIKGPFMRATGAKAWLAEGPEALRDLFRRACEIVTPGEVMIQERIPGGGENQYAYCAFFKDGEAVGSMHARRLRQHPWEFGRASTYVETVEPSVIEEYSLTLLRHIDYYGLVELEYKRDPRDGDFKLLDINPRTWGYHSLGVAAGVDFPALLYRDQLGEPVVQQRARPGVRWMRVLTDVPTALVDVVGRRLTLREYLRSLRNVSVEAVWERGDLRPGVAECLLAPYLVAKRGF
jgi:D-aspartate ligase